MRNDAPSAPPSPLAPAHLPHVHRAVPAELSAGIRGLAVLMTAALSALGCFSPERYPGPPPPEECLDGLDNDADGAIDCADSDCGAFECVAEPEPGWTGPLRIQRVAYPASEPAPPCPDGSPPLVYYTAHDEPVECGACDCAWPEATCSAPELSCYANSVTCGGSALFVHQPEEEGCVGDPNDNVIGDGSCQISGAPDRVNEGDCTATGGDILHRPPMWAEEIRVCPGATGAGCAPGEVCAARSLLSSDSPACHARQGSHLCADGTPAIDAFESGVDGRHCSACSCEGSVVSCVGGGYILYDHDQCDPGGVATFELVDDQCHAVPHLLDSDTFSYLPMLGTPVSSCIESTSVGGVERRGELTICCE